MNIPVSVKLIEISYFCSENRLLDLGKEGEKPPIKE